MDYHEYIQEVLKLGFIKDEVMAGKAIKTVLGVLASKLEKPQAMVLADKLFLDLEDLEDHQIQHLPIPVEESIHAIGEKMHLDKEQAGILVNTVLRLAKKSIGDDAITKIERNLPMDWILAVEKA
jgi:uncharacterized protein (DUF2267 family)